MALTLALTAEFFHSDFVPPICLFTGATENVVPRSMLLHYPGYDRRKWFYFQLSSSASWLLNVPVPSTWRGFYAGQLWDGLTMLALIGSGVSILILLAMLLDPPRHPITPAFVVSLCLTAFACLGMAARRQLNDCIRCIPMAEKGHFQVTFPSVRREVYQAYFAAWKSYDQAGRPKPAAKDRDDGWEDSAHAGWDQGQSQQPDHRGDPQ